MIPKNNEYGKFNSVKNNNGYLVCHRCHGYYKLKANESPGDFTDCECGNPLVYSDNIDNLLKSPVNRNKKIEDIDEMVNYLKKEARERKEVLKNLSERITIQEQALDTINKEKLVGEDNKSILDLLEEDKEIDNEINEQKRILEDAFKQEDAFLSQIRQKRNKSNLALSEADKIPLFIIIAAFILLIIIILLYIF
jgi:predicted Fe-S protein YdhL (DUF1289 family)